MEACTRLYPLIKMRASSRQTQNRSSRPALDGYALHRFLAAPSPRPCIPLILGLLLFFSFFTAFTSEGSENHLNTSDLELPLLSQKNLPQIVQADNLPDLPLVRASQVFSGTNRKPSAALQQATPEDRYQITARHLKTVNGHDPAIIRMGDYGKWPRGFNIKPDVFNLDPEISVRLRPEDVLMPVETAPAASITVNYYSPDPAAKDRKDTTDAGAMMVIRDGAHRNLTLILDPSKPIMVSEGETVKLMLDQRSTYYNWTHQLVFLRLGGHRAGDHDYEVRDGVANSPNVLRLYASGQKRFGIDIYIKTDTDANEENEHVIFKKADYSWPWADCEPAHCEFTLIIQGKTPNVSLQLLSPTYLSEGDDAHIKVKLSGMLPVDVSIPLSLTRDQPDPKTIETTSITIHAGKLSTVYSPPLGNRRKRKEQYTVSLKSPLPPEVIEGTPNSVTFWTKMPDVSLELLSPDPLPEGEDARVKVKLSGRLQTDATIPLLLRRLKPAPLTVEQAYVTIQAGELYHMYSPDLTDRNSKDAKYEILLEKPLPPKVVEGTPNSVTFDVKDRPQVKLSPRSVSVLEGDDVTITAELSYALQKNIVIPVRATNKCGQQCTAEDGDFSSLNEITIPAGSQSGTGTIHTTSDTDVQEPSGKPEEETFRVLMNTNKLPSEVREGSPNRVTITIREKPPTVNLLVSSNEIFEGESITVTAELSQGIAGSVKIPVELTPNPPADANDYSDLTGIEIPAGSLTATGKITATEDYDSGDETFTVALNESQLPPVLTAGPSTSEEITIKTKKTVTLDASPTTVNEGDSVAVVLTLSGALDTDTDVRITLVGVGTTNANAATPGWDFQGLIHGDQYIRIRANQTAGRDTISILTDHIIEKDEEFMVAYGISTLPRQLRPAIDPEDQFKLITIKDKPAVSKPVVTLSAPDKSAYEGTSVAITATISKMHPSDVVIPLTYSHTPPFTAELGDYDNTLTKITIKANREEGTLRINLTEDDKIEGDETFLVALGPPLTPDVELGSPSSVEITIKDKPAIRAPAAVTVPEGGTNSFTVELLSEPSREVTVTIFGYTGTALETEPPKPSTLKFNPKNWKPPQTVTLTASEDNDITDNEARLTLTTSGAAEYQGLQHNVLVTIKDKDTGSIHAPAVVDIQEGSTKTFEVSLSDAPSSEVTITIGNYAGTDLAITPPKPLTLTFDDKNWNVPKEVTLTAERDDDVVNEEVPLTLSASGAEYEGLQQIVTVKIDDVDTAGILANQAVEVPEGASNSFEVALSSAPPGEVTVLIEGHAGTDLESTPPKPLTLTFDDKNWNVPVTITLTASEDDDALDDPVTLTLESSGNGYVATRTVEVTIRENDRAGIHAPTTVTVPEGGAHSFDIMLSSAPSSEVVIAVTGYVGTALEATPPKPPTLKFDHTNWNIPTSITLTASDDPDVIDHTFPLTLIASGAEYQDVTSVVTVTVKDSDVTGIVANGTIRIPEGHSNSFDVALSSAPPGEVTVTIEGYAGTDLEAIPPKPLKFDDTNWNTPKPITLTASEDDDAVEDAPVMLTLKSSGSSYTATHTIKVTILENDRAGIRVPATVTVVEGNANSFEITLSSAPSREVTVVIEGHMGTSLEAAPPNPHTLTFDHTNWNTPKSVTLTASRDANIISEKIPLSLKASGAEYEGLKSTVTVIIVDNDIRGLAAAETLNVPEGGSNSFSVALVSAPSGKVTVTIEGHAGTDLEATPPNPLTLSFDDTNWKTPQSITLTASDDEDTQDDTVPLTLNSSGSGYSATHTVRVTIKENDTPGIRAPETVTVAEGSSNSFDVSLSSEPSEKVTVTVEGYAGTDLGATPPNPRILTFDDTSWNTPKSIILTASKDQDTNDETVPLTLTASGAEYDGLKGTIMVTIEDPDDVPVTVSLSASPPSVIEGGDFTVTATLSKMLPSPITIPLIYILGDPGPTEPNDYDQLQRITIPAGERNGSDKIPTKNDAILEGDETFIVALGELPTEMVKGTPSSVELTITDNDTAPPVEVTLFVDQNEVHEGDPVTVTAKLAGALEIDVEVPLRYVYYTPPTGSYTPVDHVRIRRGAREGSGQILTLPDSDTDDETFLVALGSLDPALLSRGTPSSQLVTIIDKIPPRDVGVQFSAASQSVEEGEEVTITVALSEELPADVTIPLTVVDGTADHKDYQVPALTEVVIEAGSVHETYVISTLQDDTAEPDEIFTVEFGTLPSGAEGRDPRSVKVTILDDDEAGIHAPPAVSVLEGSQASLNLSLTSNPLSEVTVSINWPSNTDLTVVPVTLLFTPANWSRSQQVTLRAANDPDIETDPVVTMALNATGGGYTGISKIIPITIIESDRPGIHAPAIVTVLEGDSETFTISLAQKPSSIVRVTIPGLLNDLTASPVNLTFSSSNWNEAQKITLNAVRDADIEDDQETLILRAAGANYDVEQTVQVIIRDMDRAGIVAPAQITMEEGSTETEMFTVRLLTEPSSPVTIRFTGHEETGLGLAKSSLTFTTTDWQTPQKVTLTASEDDTNYDDDQVHLKLSASGGGYSNTTHMIRVTILDNDEPPGPLTVSVWSQQELENAESIQLPIALSRPSDQTVTVQYTSSDGTALAGEDYTASRGIVIFDPGATRGVVEIELNDDDLPEENETFMITLSNVSDHVRILQDTGTGTIIDNDGRASLRVDDALVQKEESVVQFRVSLSHPQREIVTAAYQTQDGTAKAGEDYKATAGMLTIPPGTTDALIAVPLLRDNLDWREETFSVHLTSSKHAGIEKAVGIATIQESPAVHERVMEAYAARFVRTASVQVADALSNRFRAAADGALCAAAERAEAAQLWYSASSWDPSLGELLAGCRMSQSMPMSGGTFRIWGQGAFRQFHGRDEDALTLRGEVTAGMLGADYHWRGGWLTGVLLARSQGEGSFEVGENSGQITSGLTGIYPYVSYTRAEWDVWLTAGAGRGRAEVPGIEGDLTSRLGAAGIRGTLASAGFAGLHYHGDILVTDAEIPDHGITAEVYRIRTGLEASVLILEGIRPYIEANVRRDGGSAETGTGLELGGGVRFTSPAWRLQAEVRTQGLVIHTANGFTEWGISGSLQLGNRSEGLMMRLYPSWGRSQGMSMYRQQTILDTVPIGPDMYRTEIELGYGIPWKNGSARPLGGITRLPQGIMYRLGGELRPWEQLSFSVFGLAHRNETTPGDMGLNLQGSLRY